MLFPFLLYVLGGGISLFSLDFSVGGGLAIAPYLEGLDVTAPGYQTGHIRNNWVDWGIYAFFDAQYVEAEIGYYSALSGDYEQYDFGGPLDLKSNYDDIAISYLDLGILLKYPIPIGNDGFVFTPMLGLSYWINLNANYGYESLVDELQDIKKTDWDQLWIKVGFGLDKYLTQKLYLRFAAKINFPLETDDWKTRGNNIGQLFGSVIAGTDTEYSGIGGEFSLALGYRIK
jgi:hypothetical protein